MPSRTKQPILQPIEVEVDDWRGVEREYLRQCEATDDRVAQWLTDLRSDTGADHHRHGAKQRCHRRHEDGTKALDAGLVDRLLRCKTVGLFGLNGEVDEHDAILLDDTDEQNDPN